MRTVTLAFLTAIWRYIYRERDGETGDGDDGISVYIKNYMYKKNGYLNKLTEENKIRIRYFK
jgi:hypothetical protein